jgi:hypothetical protein
MDPENNSDPQDMEIGDPGPVVEAEAFGQASTAIAPSGRTINNLSGQAFDARSGQTQTTNAPSGQPTNAPSGQPTNAPSGQPINDISGQTINNLLGQTSTSFSSADTGEAPTTVTSSTMPRWVSRSSQTSSDPSSQIVTWIGPSGDQTFSETAALVDQNSSETAASVGQTLAETSPSLESRPRAQNSPRPSVYRIGLVFNYSNVLEDLVVLGLILI